MICVRPFVFQTGIFIREKTGANYVITETR